MNPLQVGDSIDRYTVERVLGAGGTALVYLVHHKALGTRHALKLLTVSSTSIHDRLLQEGRVQARIRHPNIVAVTDVLQIDEAPGLLLEFIEGPSLETVLREYRFTMGDGERLFQGVVAGVKAAHDHGIAHRDLKPANVLLAPTEQGFVPKVTDFGLAKVLDRGTEVGATRAGVAMGTPSYMAPEQIRDAGKVDARADLFSLGCILYELVTRRRAFPGDETLQIYNAVTRGEYIPPRHFVPDLPPRIHQAIKGCLQVDASKRIPDCDTLMAVLAGERSWTTGHTLSADDETEEIVVPRAPTLASNAPALTLAPTDLTALLDDDATTVPPELPPSLAAGPVSTPTGPPPSRSLGQLAVVAIVVFLLFGALGVGGVFAVGGLVLTEREEPAPVPVVAPVPEPAPVVAPVPEPAPVVAPPPVPEPVTAPEPEPAAAPVAAPEPTPAPATPRPRPAPAAVAPRPAPEPEPEPAPEPPAAPSEVTVKLLSVPRTAALVIDGEPAGRTPAKLTLVPGAHSVRITSGDDERLFAIEVAPDAAEQRWCYRFADRAVRVGACD